MISDRFSKIGSKPKLTINNIVSVLKDSINYLTTRSSKYIEFKLNIYDEEVNCLLNPQLISWTIENIVKNSIDAMKGKGTINIDLETTDLNIFISITDTGKGLNQNQFKTIFQTGYTTKDRGWGLGLSLSKRIIEEYHNGKIYIKSSEINKGTKIQIELNRIKG